MPSAAQADCTATVAEIRLSDLRQHPRVMCMDGGVLRLAVRPEFRGRSAMMLDISTGGIGLVLQEALPVDTVFVFEVKSAPGLDTVGRVARVRHCRPYPTPSEAPWLPPTPGVSRFFRTLFRLPAPPTEDSAWFAGCEFDRPLSDAELRQLVERLQAAAHFQ